MLGVMGCWVCCHFVSVEDSKDSVGGKGVKHACRVGAA